MGGDSGLWTGVFVLLGLWLCKEITTLIFIHMEWIWTDIKTARLKYSTIAILYYTTFIERHKDLSSDTIIISQMVPLYLFELYL